MNRRLSAGLGLTASTLIVLAAPAAADVLTVGAGGNYATIQAALDATPTASGNDQIRVRQGTYMEHLEIPDLATGDDLRLSGGWNATFTSRSQDAALTVVDGGNTGVTLKADLSAGSLTVTGFTFTDGFADGSFERREGSGSLLTLDGNAQATFRNNRHTSNRVVSDYVYTGAGLAVRLRETSHLNLLDSLFHNNLTRRLDNGNVRGASTMVYIEDGASVDIARNTFTNNRAKTDTGLVLGAGLYIQLDGTATSNVTGNLFSGNRAEQNVGSCYGSAAHFALSPPSSGTVRILRNRFLDGVDLASSDCPLVGLALDSDTARMVLRDSVIAGSPHNGLDARVYRSGGRLDLANLTIADNAGKGLVLQDVDSLFNTIFFHNIGGDTSGGSPAASGNNLKNANPLFVNASQRDYRLRPGSPAIDTGASTVPAGVGSLDVLGEPRVQGAKVDVGAFEAPAGGVTDCIADNRILCLAGGRFQVTVDWKDFEDRTGVGHAVDASSDDSGLFWFFRPNNWEMLVKVLDACSTADRFWVFGAATTNVEYTLHVLDTQSGEEREYTNPLGVRSPAITDTNAFATCP